ncbi:glycosyltransferase family 9 protein [Xanthomonas oryzae]|uniref:Glycosyltransferase family 9 protein n=1 Tax=Xanthomonas oryzae pv. leersiae TaxID=3112258 RepID=A0AAJ6GXM1_9XANT|nr:glycosyltransferase family 9 protein [Xanthomonas oryzae]WIX06507.1 glycosyltransferase family 9 protein [Xanthomonas oryzae pv. oryzae]
MGEAYPAWVVLSPWADFATKRWEPDRWRALARHVTERGFQVAIVGPPQAKALADDIVGDTHVNLPSLLRRACLVVTVDSGPLHVCDAMNVPVIGLHGLTRLSEAGPYWDDVPPSLSSTSVWSPIPYPEEIGREEAFFRRTDHRLPARSRGRHGDQGPVPAAWLQ